MLWILAGAIGGSLVTLFVTRHARHRSRHDLALQSDAEASEAQRWQEIAATVGEKLAGLATAIESNGELLLNEIGNTENVPIRAEALWTALDRLHLFSRKLLAFAGPPGTPVARGQVNVAEVLRRTRRVVHTFHPGISVDLRLAPTLPRARGDRKTLEDAFLFLVDALLALEGRVDELFVGASTKAEESGNWKVLIELQVESTDARGRSGRQFEEIQLAVGAASNLLARMHGTVAIEHIPGNKATVYVSLPAAGSGPSDGPEETHREPAGVDLPAHEFGGALILEPDPNIRTVLAEELRSSGRNVCTCADGAAARALLRSTPDRFELAIIDHQAPLTSDSDLTLEALQANAGLKVLLLTTGKAPPPELPDDLGSRLQVMHKPFGVTELRQSLRQLL